MGKIEHAPEERDAVLLAAPGTPSRLLPAVVVATGLVSVLPGVLAAELLPSTELPSILASVLLAIALSAVAARLCATAWARRPGSHAVLFADLMAWSWLYRRVSARRLEATRRRISDASAAGDAVPMATFVRLGRQLGARDVYTYGHSRRVARHAQNIARSMHLDRTEVERVRRAAAVHDIGKLHTPHGIVTKPGRLTDAEFAIVKRHPGDGARMLADLGDPELVAMVRHHHERLDGRGYPDGLSGPVIPLGARIIAVADTFDALTSTRSYRPASTHKQALAVLAAEAGRQLDEDVVAAFLRHYSASRPAAAGAAITAGAHRLLSWLGSGAAGLSSGVASLAQVVPATGAVAALTLFPAASATGVQLPATGGPAPAAAAVPAPTRDGSSTATPRPGRVRSGDVPTARMAPGATVGATRPRTEARRPAVSAPAGERAPSTAATGTAPPPQVQVPAAGRTPAAEVPAVTTPAVKTPAITTPPVKVPAVTTPAVKTPAVEVPAVTTPAITTPAVKVPAVTTPAVKVPAIEVPPVSVGAVTTPSVSIPPVEIPSTPLPSRSAP